METVFGYLVNLTVFKATEVPSVQGKTLVAETNKKVESPRRYEL